MDAQEINTALANFTGTENYYNANVFSNLKVTDGIQFLREKLNCFWLIDIVCSVQNKPKIRDNKQFIIWTIDVKDNKSAVVRAFYDSPFIEENLLYQQEIEYSDFALNHFEFYQQEDVLLLKSEN